MEQRRQRSQGGWQHERQWLGREDRQREQRERRERKRKGQDAKEVQQHDAGGRRRTDYESWGSETGEQDEEDGDGKQWGGEPDIEAAVLSAGRAGAGRVRQRPRQEGQRRGGEGANGGGDDGGDSLAVSGTKVVPTRGSKGNRVYGWASSRAGAVGAATARAMKEKAAWDDDRWRLTTALKASKKEVLGLAEARRRAKVVIRARELATLDRMKATLAQQSGSRSGRAWASQATQDVMDLSVQAGKLEREIRQARCATAKASMLAVWTKQPFRERRGRWQKGPLLGPGPLPLDATHTPKDPVLVAVERRYTWDRHGRRHARRGDEGGANSEGGGGGGGASFDNSDFSSEVEAAMRALRSLAETAYDMSLDLRQPFDRFDKNGDGVLTLREFGMALTSLNVGRDAKLSSDHLLAIFRHFDPNQSGTIHYGEFLWAFFNRASLIRAWKKAAGGGGGGGVAGAGGQRKEQTYRSIMTTFHAFDSSGDGRLSKGEFTKVLRTLGLDLQDWEIETLMQRFDTDGDGLINAPEFVDFVRKEAMKSGSGGEESVVGGVALDPAPPSTAAGRRSRSAASGSHATVPAGRGGHLRRGVTARPEHVFPKNKHRHHQRHQPLGRASTARRPSPSPPPSDDNDDDESGAAAAVTDARTAQQVLDDMLSAQRRVQQQEPLRKYYSTR